MPRRFLTAVITIAAAIAAGTVAAPAAMAQPTDAALAQRWAPVHHQDTDSSDYDADYLSSVDYDEDWIGRNNWDHQDDDPSRLTGAAYYSVVTTGTHWFVTYSFFHPRDWEDFPDPFNLYTHENDMEGALLVVRRDGGEFGALEAMITVAHTDFYSYTPAGSPFTGGDENIDGTVPMQMVNGVAHPATRQEAKGHGLYAWDGKGYPGGDGVTYYPRGAGEVPGSGNDSDVSYRLIDTFATGGLWSHRDDSATFASFGTFAGDDGKDNAANSAWGWDDGDDGGALQRGLLATDPALIVDTYFNGTGDFSRDYIRNDYR